jgi:chlorite dismutase
MTDRALHHFAGFRLAPSFWGLGTQQRADLLRSLLDSARAAAPRVEAYQVYPTRGDADLLLWSALPAAEPEAPGRFFGALARAIAPLRPHLEPAQTLWGFTRPSPYTGRRGSDREIDPVAGEREPYLVVYPFSKTPDWYLRPEGERRDLMGEHIRVGREHREVRQLLLYSFGLQDQEFVVVYETADLAAFSELVRELRGTEARRFTALDTPVLTACHLADPVADGPWR